MAEGIGSATRNRVFGNEVRRLPLDVYTAYFTVPGSQTTVRSRAVSPEDGDRPWIQDIARQVAFTQGGRHRLAKL